MSVIASIHGSKSHTCLAIGLLLSLPVAAWAVNVEEALRYVPVQTDVEYDRPSAKEIPECQIKSEEVGDVSAWVVRGPSGEILRCFTDTNDDNRVDQWRYYSNGIESYRDMDTNYNGKADQYRWLGLSGMRWGVDRNEDGQIDDWKMISPEEVTSEIVGAIRDRDVSRFASVLISADDLEDLGLSAEAEEQIRQRLSTASRRFQRAIASQRVVDGRAQWVHFSASRPGVLPAGANGNSQDIFVYENVAAMLDKGQVAIGTLLKAGDRWWAIDIPTALMEEDERNSGFLLTSSTVNPEPPIPAEDIVSEEMQKLVTEVDKVEQALAKAAPGEKDELYDRQSQLLRELASKSKTQKEQAVWIRQLAETLSTAVQSGDFPRGVKKLETLYEELASQAKQAELTGYVKFRWLTADYASRLQDAKADFPKVQEWWLEQLESFVEDYPNGNDAIEAMLQLAIAEEFSGNERPALKWYDRIVEEGESGLEVDKAKGARRRLTSVGQKLDFGGRMVDGKPVQLSQFNGRWVLIHFWATWCEPCREDMKIIQKLVAKYGSQFVPIGVNLDSDRSEVAAFLRQNRLPWPQVFESGGLDSRPAVELGILTVPTMLLLDEEGRVVNRNIHITELENFLKKNLDKD